MKMKRRRVRKRGAKILLCQQNKQIKTSTMLGVIVKWHTLDQDQGG